jgi:hypothetical protein
VGFEWWDKLEFDVKPYMVESATRKISNLRRSRRLREYFISPLATLSLAMSICAVVAATASAQTEGPISSLPDSQTHIQAQSAEKFVDSMGVNVHLEMTHGPYGNYPLINSRLSALGMRHIRDEINDTDSSFVSEINTIGQLGYRLCGLIEGGNDYPPLGTRLDPALIVPMIMNLEPTIEAVEGPNEPDDGAFVYGPSGATYPLGAIEESKDLWKIVKDSAEIRSLPVVVMSEGNAKDFLKLRAITPPPIDYADFGNMHAYQGGSVGDAGLTRWYIPHSQDLTGGEKLWTTEMGYHNNTNYLSDGEQQGVSQRASAIYLPIAFLSGFRLGVIRTFAYELIDEGIDLQLPSGSGENHYGLLNYDGSPKPAYTAMKNLISLLRDSGQDNLQMQSLSVTFSGALETMRYVLLQKSNGAYYLAIWNDVSVYRVATQQHPGKDLYPGEIPITLTFRHPENFTVFAPNDPTGVNPTSAYTFAITSKSIELDLPPEVLLVEIQSASN